MIDRQQVEAIYPVSPMQQGMLFHNLHSPDSGYYILQEHCILDGDLDVPTFGRAWQKVMDRHAVLRTAFSLGERMLQIALRRVPVPLVSEDWSHLPANEQEESLRRYLKYDLERGFDFSEAPLMRLRLMRTGQRSHYFVWSYYHGLLDGWSTALLQSELALYYQAFRNSHEPDLPSPRPYREYLLWLQRQSKGTAEAFWRRRLKGFHAATPLPLGSAAMVGTGHERSEEVQILSSAETAALQGVIRTRQLTLNTVMQGAWALVLARHSGQKDVLFGATVSGRPSTLTGAGSMIGLFINTLPVRVRLEPDEPFVSLLRYLQDAQAEAQEYAYTPLVDIQSCSEVPRGTSLFDCTLAFENYNGGLPVNEERKSSSALPPFKARSIGVSHRLSYPLALVVGPRADVILKIVYDCGRYSPTDVRRLLNQVRCVLDAVTENIEQRLSDVELLSEGERQQVKLEWNETGRQYEAKGETVPEIFEIRAEECRDAIAVVYEDEQISYRGLNGRANRLANYLVRMGISDEIRVGLCVERGIGMIVGLMGVMKAGGAYVPIEGRNPGDRLRWLVEDAQAMVLLTDERRKGELPSIWAQVVSMDGDEAEWIGESAEGREVEVGEGSLAYVMYTSGSTGRPKGVGIEHRQVVNYIRGIAERMEVVGGERMALISSIAADLGHTMLYPCLCLGGELHVVSEDRSRDAKLWEEYVEERGIDDVKMTPTHMAMLVRGERGLPRKVLVLGGESSDVEAVKKVKSIGKCEVMNHYGPTECTVGAVTHEVDGGEGRRVPIGRGLGNVKTYVLGEEMVMAPIGVSGELYIGGAGVGRGYINEGGMTAERFVPDWVSGVEGKRMYRTGDLVRWVREGELEYLGRGDGQVKVRGYRVELGEIEAALKEHEGVKQSVVVMRDGEVGEKQIVGYVVRREGVEASVGEIRKYLEGKVPGHMVPQAIVELDELPLLGNGKVNRKGLPAPPREGRGVQLGDEEGREDTPVEEIVGGIWREVLGVARVGRGENFFELGGHSLLATQVVSRIREALGVEIGLRVIFERPTVDGIGDEVERERRKKRAGGEEVEEGTGRIERIRRIDVGDGVREAALSYAQQRLWFIQQLEPESVAYNIPRAIRLRGALSIEALRQSLSEIARRHEVLRTRFEGRGGIPVQVIEPVLDVDLSEWDISAEEETNREELGRQIVREEGGRAFDLERGPVWRAALIRLGEDEHVLVLNVHHIVSDAWSTGIMVNEFAALYEGNRVGRASGLRDLEIQYADYSEWQRGWMTGEVLEQEMDYWRRELGGVPALELPTDRTRPAVASHRGAKVPFRLTEELTEDLRRVSRREGVTLFMTLLAAFQVVLSRYAGQDDFAVGTPIANRGRLETEGLIGFFINQLVLRTDLGGNPSLRELLVRVRERTLGAYEHQEVPFEKLVEELSPERDLSRPPLSQVELVLHNTPLVNESVAGIEFAPYTADYGFAKFELMFLLGEGRGIGGTAEYATDLFERTTIERFVDHLYLVLSLIAKDTRSRIRDIDLLTAGERQRLLFDWNDTDCDYGDTRCLHQLFEEQTERTPDTVVADYDEHQLSYGELNRRSNQLARVLNARGIMAESGVGICIGRSLEMLVGILGALKAGGAYVPMDPSYPEDRILYMIANSGVTLVLTEGKYKAIAAQAPGDRICVDTDWRSIATQSDHDLNALVHPEMLAYVIYTSGSTGQPKGVGISNRSAWSFLNWAHSGYGAAGGATVLASTSICFDLSIFELFLPLCFGGRIVIAENALGLPGLAAKDSVSLINTVPSAIGALLDAGHLPEAVATVNLAGEALSGELVERLFEAGIQDVYNLYGPTETTTYSTFGRIERGAAIPPTIGRPVGNTQIHLLDASLCPAPVGAIGETYIGGSGLARGYLRRPDLTAERFLPCPSANGAGARQYRTGDLARYREDGRIEYLGRQDRQVKMRGYRIELGEIESVLAAHETVRQCAVTIAEDEIGHKRMVAYVSSATGATAKPSELRAYATGKLPAYMVPHAFVELPELPMTANGKLDRKVLQAVKSEPSVGKFAGLRTPVEEIVAAVWSDVLRLDGIGPTDDFFELGGHSLLATQVVSRLREMLHVHLSLRLLFEHPTVSGFAGSLEQVCNVGGKVAPSPPITRADRTVELPLSYAQQRLWFLQQLTPDSAAYNISRALRLTGPLSSFALEQSVHEIVRRHEILRTRFQTISGVPRVEIDAFQETDLPLCDLRRISEEEQKSIIEKAFAKEGQNPFDITAGPLWRARLLQSGDQAHILLLCMHHIVSDAWSMSVMVNEINSFYSTYRVGGPGSLAELAVQYADFAVWQREWLQAEVLEAHTAYWKQELAGAKLLDLPTDRPRPSMPSYRGAQERFSLSEDVTRGLQELSRREGVTLFMTLLAGVQLLLSRYTGQEDVAIGTVIAGRDRSETEKLIGFFVNQLVMRTDLSGNPTVHDLLGRVRDTALGAYAHQELPFERLIGELQLHRRFGSQPFSQFVFAFQNVPRENLALSHIQVVEDSLNLHKANFDLTLFMALDRGQLHGSLIYATDLYNRQTIRRLLWRLERVLQSLLIYAEPLAGAARTASG